MRFPKELCSQRSIQSDIDMLSSWRLSLRTSWVVDGPELRSWFFPLLLLSNFSLSPRNDLLLLFLVWTPIFFSQVSQKLSRKHLLCGSTEITCRNSGQLRVLWLSRNDHHGRLKGSKVEWSYHWNIWMKCWWVIVYCYSDLVFPSTHGHLSILHGFVFEETKGQWRWPKLCKSWTKCRFKDNKTVRKNKMLCLIISMAS